MGEMEVDADARAYDALSKHPRVADLAAVACVLLKASAEERRVESLAEVVAPVASKHGLTREDAATSFGNALDVLSKGPSSAEERSLARALAAHAMAAQAPMDAAAERVAAEQWLWLAAHTPFDALTLAGAALGDRAPDMWAAVTDVIRGGLAKVVGPPPRRARGLSETFRGQMSRAPRGPFVTAVLGLTGILLVEHLGRLFGRWALAYKTPAEIAVAEDGGLRVRWRVELLGRILIDRDVFMPREALALATREVRFSGLALYAGLLSLAVGSYVGVSAFVDGARAASPAMLASGLAIVSLGLGLDFFFACALPGARGHCRVLFSPRRGPKLCVGDIDRAKADVLLGHLAHA